MSADDSRSGEAAKAAARERSASPRTTEPSSGEFTLQTQVRISQLAPVPMVIMVLAATWTSSYPIATAAACALYVFGNVAIDRWIQYRLRRGLDLYHPLITVRFGFSVVAFGLITYAYGPGPGWFTILPGLTILAYAVVGRWPRALAGVLALSALTGHVLAGGSWDTIVMMAALGIAFAVINPDLASVFRNSWESSREAAELLRKANVELERRKQELEVLLVEARQATAAKSAFLANMSHEIRTPLNGMSGALHLLLEDHKLDEEAEELAQIAQSSIDVLVRVVSDILDFSKIEAGRLEIECAPMSPGEEALRVVAGQRPEAEAKGIELSVSVAPDVPESVLGDSVRFGQILRNFVSNGVKFTSEGRVDVSLSLDHRSRLEVRVTDTGVGIEEAALERIFDPFEQADVSTTRRFGGTGLGLAICRQLIGMMDGQIGCESTPGVGSTFWFALPFEAARAPSLVAAEAVQPSESSEGGALERLRVLLVEDNEVNRLVAQRLLSRESCDVLSAANGVEALQIAADQAVDLIMMDRHMPGMDGIEATRELRRREQVEGLPHTPILALTASALVGDRAECEAAGMDGFLSKPIDPEALAAALRQVRRKIARER